MYTVSWCQFQLLISKALLILKDAESMKRYTGMKRVHVSMQDIFCNIRNYIISTKNNDYPYTYCLLALSAYRPYAYSISESYFHFVSLIKWSWFAVQSGKSVKGTVNYQRHCERYDTILYKHSDGYIDGSLRNHQA